jgi:hypothetical protein
MVSQARRGGRIQLQVNGELQDAKGAFTYNLGQPKREDVVGSDRVHGFKEMPQAPFIEGKITDRGTLDLQKLVSIEDATVTLELANGKSILLREAWFAGEGNVSTEDGEIDVRFVGRSAEELTAT